MEHGAKADHLKIRINRLSRMAVWRLLYIHTAPGDRNDLQYRRLGKLRKMLRHKIQSGVIPLEMVASVCASCDGFGTLLTTGNSTRWVRCFYLGRKILFADDLSHHAPDEVIPCPQCHGAGSRVDLSHWGNSSAKPPCPTCPNAVFFTRGGRLAECQADARIVSHEDAERCCPLRM